MTTDTAVGTLSTHLARRLQDERQEPHVESDPVAREIEETRGLRTDGRLDPRFRRRIRIDVVSENRRRDKHDEQRKERDAAPDSAGTKTHMSSRVPASSLGARRGFRCWS